MFLKNNPCNEKIKTKELTERKLMKIKLIFSP